MKNLSNKTIARAKVFARAIVLTVRRLPWPKVPERWVALVRYVRDASAVERRVIFGIAIAMMIEAPVVLYGVFVVAIAQGIFAAVIAGFLFALLGLGLSLPPFVGIAWGGLFRRHWTFFPDGIREKWVNPHIELEEPFDQPGYVRRIRGKGKVVVQCVFPGYIGPLPERRKHMLYTTTSVHSAVYHEPDEEHFRQPAKGPMMPIRMGAIAVITLGSLFFIFALATNPESF